MFRDSCNNTLDRRINIIWNIIQYIRNVLLVTACSSCPKGTSLYHEWCRLLWWTVELRSLRSVLGYVVTQANKKNGGKKKKLNTSKPVRSQTDWGYGWLAHNSVPTTKSDDQERPGNITPPFAKDFVACERWMCYDVHWNHPSVVGEQKVWKYVPGIYASVSVLVCQKKPKATPERVTLQQCWVLRRPSRGLHRNNTA